MQEEIASSGQALEDKTAEVSVMRQELESAKELLSYLKHDTSSPISPELQEFVRGQGFSVPRLYHEYRIVLEKLAESQKVALAAQAELENRSEVGFLSHLMWIFCHGMIQSIDECFCYFFSGMGELSVGTRQFWRSDWPAEQEARDQWSERTASKHGKSFHTRC